MDSLKKMSDTDLAEVLKLGGEESRRRARQIEDAAADQFDIEDIKAAMTPEDKAAARAAIAKALREIGH